MVTTLFYNKRQLQAAINGWSVLPSDVAKVPQGKEVVTFRLNAPTMNHVTVKRAVFNSSDGKAMFEIQMRTAS